jgi:hypothetical protein
MKELWIRHDTEDARREYPEKGGRGNNASIQTVVVGYTIATSTSVFRYR